MAVVVAVFIMQVAVVAEITQVEDKEVMVIIMEVLRATQILPED